MTAEDLENPLRVDDCARCGAVHWRDCICDPSRPHQVPTPDELEAARDERLSQAERGRGAR